MNQFVQRLANWLANEVIVKGLAESRIFQRMALKTHETVNEAKAKASQHVESTVEELNKMAADSSINGKGPPQPPLRGVPGFFAAFAKEVRKDIVGTK